MILRFRMWKLIRDQSQVIQEQRQELQKMQLVYARNVRDLVEQFFIAQEAGWDVRDQLMAGLSDLQDEVARLEEHYG